jgi:tRNA(adenine34) deaminase
METKRNDTKWMKIALEQAVLAGEKGEVPVGAALVRKGKLIASAGNCPISRNDPTAHAEIIVLRKAAKQESNYRLPGTTLFVTLEPCTMCVGAIIHARVDRVVFGAADPKTGALVSLYTIGSDNLLNHKLTISSGVLADKCADLLKDFFRRKRKNRSM